MPFYGMKLMHTCIMFILYDMALPFGFSLSSFFFHVLLTRMTNVPSDSELVTLLLIEQDSDFEKPSNEHMSGSIVSKDISTDTHQSCTSPNVSSLSIPEAQQCMSLYFALCTKVLTPQF